MFRLASALILCQNIKLWKIEKMQNINLLDGYKQENYANVLHLVVLELAYWRTAFK